MFMLERCSSCEATVEGFLEVNDHDPSGLDCDSKQCDVVHPNGHGKVVSEEFLQDESPRKGVDRRKNKHSRFGNRMKDHVKQQEDDEEHDRQNELQPLLCSQLGFILSRPFI